MKIAFVTIGQTPRKDIIDDIKDLLHGIEYIEYGALDGLSKEEIIERFTPKPDEEFYVTRLRDGSEVKVSKEAINRRVEELVKSIEDHVDTIIVLCTGDFKLYSKKPIIFPGRLLVKIVEALAPRSLGVIIPSPGQEDMAYRRWSRISSEVVVRAWSPYTGSVGGLARLSWELSGCDLIVMDCIGYSRSHCRIVREFSGRPTLIPRLLTIAVALSILGA